MKKTILAMFLFSLLLPSVLALENTTTENATTENPSDTTVLTDTGITPDRPLLYGLDRALDRVRLALTFNEDKKAELGLKIAEERLLEAKQMALQNKTRFAEKAINGYQKRMSEVNKRMEGITKKQVTKERIQRMIRIQTKAEELEMNVEDLNETLVLRGASQGLQEKLKNAFETQTRVKTRIREHTQKVLQEEVESGLITEEEAENFLIEKEKLLAEETINKTQKQIERIQVLMQRNSNKFNTTSVQKFLTRAVQKLDESKEYYNNSDYQNAVKTAFEAKFIADHSISGGMELENVIIRASRIRTRIENRNNIAGNNTSTTIGNRTGIRNNTTTGNTTSTGNNTTIGNNTNVRNNVMANNTSTGNNTSGNNTIIGNNTIGNNTNTGNNTIGNTGNNTIGNNTSTTIGNTTSTENNTIGNITSTGNNTTITIPTTEQGITITQE